MQVINEETLQDGRKISIIRNEYEDKIEYIFRTEDNRDLWKIEIKTEMSDLEQEFLRNFIPMKDSIIDF